MGNINIKILNDDEQTLAVGSSSGDGVSLVHTAPYQPGDGLVIDVQQPGLYALRLDEALPETVVWLAGNECIFPVPTDRVCYSPKAFRGDSHLITARPATAAEAATRRNLALNPYDHHTAQGIFPHATANVETRGEAVFAARNAIDGIYANSSHGGYPYGSWGINRDPAALMRLDFGRPVQLDCIGLTLRADFPHDNWWKQVTITFSDGSSETISLQKCHLPQRQSITPRLVEWLELGNLIKSDEPSPFPALTQLEAFGTEVPQTKGN